MDNKTIPITDLGDSELKNILASLESKCESLCSDGHGHGNTKDFWAAVEECVKIRGELDYRKAKYRDTF